jgi:hypothetical protein
MNTGILIVIFAAGCLGIIAGIKLKKKVVIIVSSAAAAVSGFLVLMTLLLVCGIK